MADLNPLIRLRKFRVEEKQKILADLFRQAELLEGRKRAIFEEIERERQLAESGIDIEALVTFAAYSARMASEVERLNSQLKKLDVKIERAQEDMREAFSEQKKAQIIQQRRDDEERAEIDAKENKNLDEIGIEVFRRLDDKG
ncbi:MAG: flagellar FliJ family protein [Alphaproteobacteria bacterium]|nr:flagellar FliJ family protein [Alphaproteobacteria bacterium]MCB9984927.1 flagellar FliJ family protein [Micavibrio sp.]HPQ50475.1 flagellar export protein FliJ [Alphaproteobacteria bacterium]